VKKGSTRTVSDPKYLLPSSEEMRSFSAALTKLMTPAERDFLRNDCLSGPSSVPHDMVLTVRAPVRTTKGGRRILGCSWLVYYFRKTLRFASELSALYWARVDLLEQLATPEVVRRVFVYLESLHKKSYMGRHLARAFLYDVIKSNEI
jgi:hypothetical protein